MRRNPYSFYTPMFENIRDCRLAGSTPTPEPTPY